MQKKDQRKFYSTVNTNYKTTEYMIIKLKLSEGNTKLKLYQNISIYYDETNYRRQSGYFQFEEKPFAKNA